MRRILAKAALAFSLTFTLGLAAIQTSGGAPGTRGANAGQEPHIYPIRREPFAVDVIVSGRSLEVLHARGRRYVEAVEGAEYALRIRNPLPVRVAVALSVDGLSTIDARRTSSRDASKWVIEPHSSITISGWQMSSRKARRFYFTSERDSYAARLGRTADLGVISAVFYREARAYPVPLTTTPRGRDEGERRRKGSEPSRDSSTARSDAAESSALGHVDDERYAATGIGRGVDHSVMRIHLDLEREPAAEISLRYEFRDALIKLGVLPRDRRDDPLRRRERASGFDDGAFCPEP